jgi:hypothetical protein
MATLVCLWLAGPRAAHADDVQVAAAISDDGPDVGESVDYTITVNGASDASVPQNINVDGLTITYEGPSSQTQIRWGTGMSGPQTQTSVIHTYSVVPQRNGDFTIPAQQVEVGGRTFTTQPITFKAGNGAASANGASGGNGAADQTGGNGKLFYAEFVLPRNTAYIGEALPIEIRLYVDARVRAQLEEAPEITANGCTVEKTTKPDQSEITKNGREYVMVTYKTAVTPAKAGELKVGPVQVAAIAQIPQRRRRMSGGPFDDPFFQNQAFDDAFQMMSPPQQVQITGDAVPLTALPLPAKGQPRSFSGAVGSFSMTTSVKPAMVEAGDPVTVTAKISGNGNFDRVTAPQLTDATGWRTYPPSSTFDGSDDSGTSGTKTFQIAAIAQTDKTRSPGLEWSYFDPQAGKYVTLTDNGVPIKIEGEVPTIPAPVLAQGTPAAAAVPAQNPAAPDISYIRADSSGWGATFQPLYQNRIFWMTQGAPFLALLAFVSIEAARKRAADEEARRLAQLRKEKDNALSAMQRRDIPESELFQAAARALRLEAAMQLGRDPETLDGTEVAGARALDDATAERVRQLFDQQAEALYAGSSGGKKPASAETRAAALDTVKGYENARPSA